MALGRKCSAVKSRRGGANAEQEVLELGVVKYTRGLGRKRIVISNVEESSLSPLDSVIRTPLKRQCSGRMIFGFEKSPLEALPQDILIRILCGVDHEDLKQLFHVSKAIREATLFAKKSHFAYTTPRKTAVFRTPIDFDDSSELDDIEAPNAPRQERNYRSRLTGRSLASISVALFG
ncbi:F-box protein SKIP27-like [Carica papaya]|uniref:F-box protein SKIP27-like n=1 Tax=Carica papaya TaxID=3649 RepID=UPI000B8CEEB4|nr:F-box protein SKIP27-like [Carica papaya]